MMIKNHLKALYFIVLISSINLYGQTKKNPFQFSLGVNAIDVFPTGSEGYGVFFEDFFNLSEHWNFSSIPLQLEFKKYQGSGFSFGFRFNTNTIKKYGNTAANDTYYNFDAILKYDTNALFKMKRLEPFFEIGGGYSIFNDQGAGFYNFGFGLEYLLGKKKIVGISFETIFKKCVEAYSFSHFHHSFTLGYRLYNNDSDGDGFTNRKDSCPDTAGVAIFNGCPDTDDDGIQDANDDCPNVSGLPQFNGCLDSDNDGIGDQLDKCPNIPGNLINKGCIALTNDVVEEFVKFQYEINFEVGRFELTSKTLKVLDQLYTMLLPHSNHTIGVTVFTESIGDDQFNQLLSQKRAQVIKGYLIKKGMDASLINAIGKGEAIPENTDGLIEDLNQRNRVLFRFQE